MKDQAKALHALQILRREVQAARMSAARAARRRAQKEAALAMDNHSGIRALLIGSIREGAGHGVIRRMEDTRARCAGRLDEAQEALQEAEQDEAREAAAAVVVEKRIEGLEHVLDGFARQELFVDEEP